MIFTDLHFLKKNSENDIDYSWQEKCIKIPVESLSYDVTVCLISSLMSFYIMLS